MTFKRNYNDLYSGIRSRTDSVKMRSGYNSLRDENDSRIPFHFQPLLDTFKRQGTGSISDITTVTSLHELLKIVEQKKDPS